MKPDFDLFEFLQNLRATKPPYECPYNGCHKVYKSCSGMEGHLQKVNHNNGHNNHREDGSACISSGKRKDGVNWKSHDYETIRTHSPDSIRPSTREALTYAEAQKMVEFEVDGKIFRIDINEPLNIVHVDGKNGDIPATSLSCSGTHGDNDLLRSSHQPSSSTTTNINEPKTSGKGKPTKGKGKKSKPGKYGSKNKKDGSNNVGVNSCLTVSCTAPNNSLQLKLPEPSFRIIEDYQSKDVSTFPRKKSYYRYIEKATEDNEGDENKTEYDMDEEDTAWLELVNKKRKAKDIPDIPADTFEELMDKLEKESYFQSQNSGKEVGPAIDEDAVCCICNDGECQNSNAILFCDMCNLAVHQECYGVPYIPEGQWLCRRCLQSPSRAVDCVLCPNKGGAFKQTDDNKWAHVVCALWIPEVCFANTVFLEPIDSIHQIPSARWKLSCYICKQRSVGACIQCHKPNCYVAFHVTCAQQAGLYMKMDAVKEMTASGVVTNVRKAAFCDAHTPADDNGTQSLSGVYSSVDEDSKSESKRAKQTKAHFKERMKKARKILAEKRCAIPVVSVPTMPIEKLNSIIQTINVPKRNQFLQLLLGYWTLKRQSRNGVPLLRRLQISYSANRKGGEASREPEDDEHVIKLKKEHKNMQRLRQDLERARLLVELIRKRERTKKLLVKALQDEVEAQLNPFKIFLRLVLSALQVRDTQQFFAEPVDVNEVPDYRSFIDHPMDFQTMSQKIEKNEYESFSSFESDFKLMLSNCMKYNTKDTVYHKAALRMSDHGDNIFKDARSHLNEYNEKTGLFVTCSPLDFQASPVKAISHDISIDKTSDNNDFHDELAIKLENLERELRIEKENTKGERTHKCRSLSAEIGHTKRAIRSRTNVNSTISTSTQPSVASSSPGKQTRPSPNARARVNNKIPRNRRKNRVTSESEANTGTASDLVDSRISTLTSNCTSILPIGRKTQNSIVATLNSHDIIPNMSFNNISRESQQNNSKRKRNSNKSEPTRSRKSLKLDNNNTHKTKPVANGTSKITDHFFPIGRRKVNGSSLNDQISPDSNSSFSSLSNPNHDNTSTILKTRNATRQTRKAVGVVDASTCTPPNMFTETAESFAKEQAIKGQERDNQIKGGKRRSNRPAGRNTKRHQSKPSDSSLQLSDATNSFSPSIPHQSDSFRVYRNLSSPADSDINSNHSSQSTGSSSLSTGTSESSGSGSSSGSRGSSRASSRSTTNRVTNNTNNNSNSKRLPNSPRRTRSQSSSHSEISIDNQIQLEPNDLVWAKSPGFPWYPALIVNPDKPKTDKNGVSIPIPPHDVLTSKERESKKPVYLVSFFDVKRTWQWLTRDKLEPLGITDTDQVKLTEARKAADKKSVKKAYETAVMFLVTLKKADLS